jgi:hypothetical protein
MSDERAAYLQRCRVGLCSHATSARDRMSAAEWEDAALASEAGMAVGSREIDAIVHLVWGLSGRRMRLR